MHSVLDTAIKKIEKENSDELRGELRGFMEIHGAGIKQTKKGEEVLHEKIGGRISYYTKSQKFFD